MEDSDATKKFKGQFSGKWCVVCGEHSDRINIDGMAVCENHSKSKPGEEKYEFWSGKPLAEEESL